MILGFATSTASRKTQRNNLHSHLSSQRPLAHPASSITWPSFRAYARTYPVTGLTPPQLCTNRIVFDSSLRRGCSRCSTSSGCWLRGINSVKLWEGLWDRRRETRCIRFCSKSRNVRVHLDGSLLSGTAALGIVGTYCAIEARGRLGFFGAHAVSTLFLNVADHFS